MSYYPLRDGLIDLFKNAFKNHSHWSSGKYFNKLAGLDCLFGLHVYPILKSFSHRFTDIVFTTRTSTFANNAAVVFNFIFNLREWSNISSVPNNVEFRLASFSIRLLSHFSFDSENDSHKIINFCSSNSHSGIVKPSLSLLKYLIVSW